MSYRTLTDDEIRRLEEQGCTADDWQGVQVLDPFITDHMINVRFSGEIRIGRLQGEHYLEGGYCVTNSLKDSALHNCTIADNVYIDHLRYAANIDFESHSEVRNVDALAVNGETTFGNGLELEVMNEAGGRSLPMFDRLSAQIAYMLVFYRHDKELIDKLTAMIDAYVKSRSADRGRVGVQSKLTNCGRLLNVNIGPFVAIEGATELQEGTVLGCEQDPSVIGAGVTARRFIIQSGSHIQDSALLTDCFIGQGVRISRQFSAENSAFFANCEAMHGEACSLFAGPYTATHHKSSLLIAGLFSFYNAGSGTNQSNHLYKLGPLHQGVLERGVKTGSSSYMLWPTRVGAFSVVLGKHYSNFDASDFPFSYINEEKGKSVITPAMNIFTVGTRRDSQKWPKRDKRKDPQKYDLIHFGLFTPYVGERILRGMRRLEKLQESGSKQEYLNHKGIFINRLMLKICRKYYDMAIKVVLGESLLRFFEQLEDNTDADQLEEKLLNASKPKADSWIDMAGMLASRSVVDDLIEEIKASQSDIDQVYESLLQAYEKYDQQAIAWTIRTIQSLHQLSPEELPVSVLIQVLEDWKTAALKLNKMTMQDAMKEFDTHTRIGYGIDGDEAEKENDFLAVRQSPEENPFIQMLKDDDKEIESRYNFVLQKLQQL
jgi:hypothetical protein